MVILNLQLHLLSDHVGGRPASETTARRLHRQLQQPDPGLSSGKSPLNCWLTFRKRCKFTRVLHVEKRPGEKRIINEKDTYLLTALKQNWDRLKNDSKKVRVKWGQGFG